MSDIKENVFYRPKVEIERDYSTNGSIQHQDSNNINDNDYIPSTDLEDALDRSEKVQDDLLQIRKVLDILPPKTVEVLKDIVDKLIFQAEDEKKKIKDIVKEPAKNDPDKEPSDDDKRKTDAEFSSTDTIDSGPLTFWKDPDPIDIEITVVKAKENNELAYEQYLKDSTAIKEDFVYKLNSVMQDYIYPLMTVMGEIGLDSKDYLTLEYEGESITGVQDDDKHLHDKIVRNQTIIDEKNRKFMKTHSPNNTLAIMSAFDIVSQQRVKYYAEEYDLGINSYAGIYKRNMLEDSRKEYEAKYGRAKVNMYKYLNSSAVITGDILKKTLEVDTAKCYLLAQDVNIYARKRYEAAGYENNTDDTSVDLENNPEKANSTTNSVISSNANKTSKTNSDKKENNTSNDTVEKDKNNSTDKVIGNSISERLNQVLTEDINKQQEKTNKAIENNSLSKELDKLVSDSAAQTKKNLK